MEFFISPTEKISFSPHYLLNLSRLNKESGRHLYELPVIVDSITNSKSAFFLTLFDKTRMKNSIKLN